MKKTTKRRSRSRRSRRGNAGAPKTRPGIPHHYEAADVLAGAYGRGSRMREDQTFLVHTAVCNVRGGILHALCKRIPVDNLITDAGPIGRPPTCPVCASRLATAVSKGTALPFAA